MQKSDYNGNNLQDLVLSRQRGCGQESHGEKFPTFIWAGRQFFQSFGANIVQTDNIVTNQWEHVFSSTCQVELSTEYIQKTNIKKILDLLIAIQKYSREIEKPGPYTGYTPKIKHIYEGPGPDEGNKRAAT